MPELTLLRHGQSEWNRLGRFTGWVDIGLTRRGRGEAREAGERLRAAGVDFRFAFTSYLRRAIHTLWIVLDTMDRAWVDVHKDCRLNERHYGALQGLSKRKVAERHGDEQVRLWRRGYDVPVPPGGGGPDQDDGRYRGLIDVPDGETLRQTVARVMGCWEEHIAGRLRQGDSVLVVAHGNSLRGLMMRLERIAESDIPGLELRTGIPIVYSLDRRLRVRSKRVLEHTETRA